MVVLNKKGDADANDASFPRYLKTLIPATGAAVTYGVSLHAAQARKSKKKEHEMKNEKGKKKKQTMKKK